MSTDTDWQARFQQLAVQQEEDTRRFASAEKVLCRTIVRLCAAGAGFDPVLDPHFARIKAAVKNGYDATLEQRLNEFGDTLVGAVDQVGGMGLLDRFIVRLDLPGKQARKLQQAWQVVARDPGHAADEAVDEVLALLGAAPAAVENDGGQEDDKARNGLLGRLLKHDPVGTPNKMLDDLLARIAWPQSLGDEIGALRRNLAEGSPSDAWVHVVERLSALVLQVMQDSQAQVAVAESFLAELTARLGTIEAHVSGEASDRDAAKVRGEELSAAVQGEVEGLAGRLYDSNDLGQLKTSFSAGLDRLQQFVEDFLSAERRRYDSAVAREAALREELARVEQESQELRDKIVLSQDQASRDALTGLPNRRAYDARMSEEVARYKRFGEPLSLVVFDLDNFKQINDRFGHRAGDKALKVIARLLKQRMRETDFLARYGGEEFVLLLPGASSEDALALADKMRAAVVEAGLHSKGKPVYLTISGGVASLRDGDTPDAIFERADQGLYQAKAAGKDRIVVAA
jgi:diguanylate cyclase